MSKLELMLRGNIDDFQRNCGQRSIKTISRFVYHVAMFCDRAQRWSGVAQWPLECPGLVSLECFTTRKLQKDRASTCVKEILKLVRCRDDDQGIVKFCDD